jgi:hypothetical protein
MADDVTTQVLLSEKKRHVLVRTSASDGTGEDGAVVVDRSSLVDIHGDEPTALRIERIEWAIGGFSYLKLEWDHTSPDKAMILPAGAGEMCFDKVGGLKDPGSAGGTGDLIVTTPAGVATGVYTLMISLRL